MRLLVTGANGQLGWELSRSLTCLGEVIALRREECDLAKPELLPEIIRDLKPDIVVNAAAYTAVDKAEQEEELAFTVNAKSVEVLSQETRRSGALLIHYSTDYVFDGKKDAPYGEEDTACPINIYGRSKLAGEKAVSQLGGEYITLRTSWVYAARGHNFVRTVLKLARERDELYFVSDQVGAPTWARDIAELTMLIVQAATRERIEHRFSSGLFHMTAGGATNWYEFAETIIASSRAAGLLLDSDVPRLHAIGSEQFKQSAARPKNSRLNVARLRDRFGIVLPCWNEALPLCLKEMTAS